MGQEIGGLTHQIDPKIFVVDADVDVHAADHQPPGHRLKVPGEGIVAVLVGVNLLFPAGEGMGGGGDGGEVIFAGDLGDGGAQFAQFPARLGNGTANIGRHLDLGLQELGLDQALEPRLAFLEHFLRRIFDKVAAVALDEEILLLDTDCQGGFRDGHQ